MRVMNKALKITSRPEYPNKLNETIIDSCMVFFRLPGSSKASYSEITFGQLRLRQERESPSLVFHVTVTEASRNPSSLPAF